MFSHPKVRYSTHINNLLQEGDTSLTLAVKQFHDIGKCRTQFQKYIQGEWNTKNKEHSQISAFIFLKLFYNKFSTKELFFGFISILRHHGYIHNFNVYTDNREKDIEYDNNSLSNIYMDIILNNNSDSENIHINKLICDLDISGILEDFEDIFFNEKFSIEDYSDFRCLFSNLVYSDKYEAINNTSTQEKLYTSLRDFQQNIGILKDGYKNYVKKFKSDSEINIQRTLYSDGSFANLKGSKDGKVFTLVGATGIGKTLTSLRCAIELEPRKIIYVLPFTNIIEQIFSEFSEIYKGTGITVRQQHHRSNIYEDEDENTNSDRSLSQIVFDNKNFNADINITTTYQLMYSLFGNSNQEFVKFHQLQGSVIIIDETQSISEDIKKDFLEMCEVLTKKMDIRFIFMSATMPKIDTIKHIPITDERHFDFFDRYYLKFELESLDYFNRIVELSQEYRSVMCVVNQISTAKELYISLNEFDSVYILHGEMTSQDKENIVKKVTQKIKNNEKIILISTQSIEAGVDLDFDVGIREFSPISSIIQTAGRVNRNGKKPKSILYIMGLISQYSTLIYGDLLVHTHNILTRVKKTTFSENENKILIKEYFSILDESNGNSFHSLYKELKFEQINKKIDDIFKNDYKKLVYIEPSVDYFKEFESAFYEIDKLGKNKFENSILKKKKFFEITEYGVSLSKNNYDNVTLNTVLSGNIEYILFDSIGQYEKEFGIVTVTDFETNFI